MHNTFKDTAMNAVSQQSCNSHGRSWYTGRGNRLIRYTAPPHLRAAYPIPISRHLHQISSVQTLQPGQCCTTLQTTCCYKEPDTGCSTAVISVSCDGHCIVEYRESRSPVGLGISQYGDLPKIANLLDRDIGDVDRHTSSI